MTLELTECMATECKLLQDLAAYDNIIGFIKNIVNSKDAFCALHVSIKFNDKCYKLRDFGKLADNADQILKELRKLPAEAKAIPNDYMSIKADGFERELFIDLDPCCAFKIDESDQNDSYLYKETEHPLTKDVMWQIDDISLAENNDVEFLANTFIKKYPHKDYSLAIFDTNTQNILESDCDFDDIPQKIDYIYKLENGRPLTFIGVDSLSERYVVGMSLFRGIAKYALAKR